MGNDDAKPHGGDECRRLLEVTHPLREGIIRDAYAPLSSEFREALAALVEMRWPGAEEELTAEKRAEFKRLTQPTSPDFILNAPSYYAFFTYSMFWGRVPA
ncbi:MAG TPA: hypothetical protein VMX79_01035 [bacterium]|nr:hypothetical protein [bacterium]